MENKSSKRKSEILEVVIVFLIVMLYLSVVVLIEPYFTLSEEDIFRFVGISLIPLIIASIVLKVRNPKKTISQKLIIPIIDFLIKLLEFFRDKTGIFFVFFLIVIFVGIIVFVNSLLSGIGTIPLLLFIIILMLAKILDKMENKKQ